MYDVIVIGGSYAGLSAALQLARGRRSVLVFDTGERRNRFAAASHGFLTHDGSDPARIAAVARAQLLAYPTVTWLAEAATHASSSPQGFRVTAASGRELFARRLVLATGVRDELPDIPGLAERWGRAVFHCPYCHGYELGGGPIGALATSAQSIQQALMLPDWGETSYFTRGLFEPSSEERAALERRHVAIERSPVTAVTGAERPELHLEDGRVLALTGLFLAPQTQLSSALALQLGCELDESPTGSYVRTDATKETTVAGVFACGDMALAAHAVADAVGDGARAGRAAHRSLMFRA